MKQDITVTSPLWSQTLIRSASQRDLEDLRQWKNENRFSFFHTDLISADQQAAWFANYLARDLDFMFMVEDSGYLSTVGCLGIRWTGAGWDIYNVILGLKSAQGSGAMSRGLALQCAFAMNHTRGQISLSVLSANPAVSWYKRNHFSQIGSGNGYQVLERNCNADVPLIVVQGMR